MPKQFLVNIVLASALLFSQGGSFLIAALCPHLQSGTASCEAQVATPTMSHEQMAHEEMGHAMHHGDSSEPESFATTNPGKIALSQLPEACSHCAIHSGTTPTGATLRFADTVKRSFDLNIPLAASRVGSVVASSVSVLSSRAHGPPGETVPRHLLINIFRL